MSWPRNTDYNEAIQNLRSSVSDEELREGEPALNPLGVPFPYSGNFADVYKVRCPKTGNTWAVKCFTREIHGLRERYREISAHLSRRKLGFMVDFNYVEPGIRAAGGCYPFLKMRWVEGQNLNQFVGDYLDRPKMLKQLLGLWVKLSERLRKAEVAHADLQHGNVLLVAAGGGSQLELKLIDYDGMYVPALSGKRSGESGHPAFQHPERLRERIFGAEVDRFPHLVIYTAIHALTLERRTLWQEFDSSDNLLFRECDFADPCRSKLFCLLWALKNAELHALVGRLILACRMPLDRVPLLEEVVDNGRVRPLSREEERQASAVMDGGVRAASPVAPVALVPPARAGEVPLTPGPAQPAAQLPSGPAARPDWWTAGPPTPSLPVPARPVVVVPTMPSLEAIATQIQAGTLPAGSPWRDVAASFYVLAEMRKQERSLAGAVANLLGRKVDYQGVATSLTTAIRAAMPTSSTEQRVRAFHGIGRALLDDSAFWESSVPATAEWLLDDQYASGGLTNRLYIATRLENVWKILVATKKVRTRLLALAGTTGVACLVIALALWASRWNRSPHDAQVGKAIAGRSDKAQLDEPMPADEAIPGSPAMPVAPFDAAEAKAAQTRWAEFIKAPGEQTNTIGMKLVMIPPGEFMMGSPDSRSQLDQRPQHRVRITKPFWLGAHEVTVGQFRKFADETKHANDAWRDGPDLFPGQTDEHPVVRVSWKDADAFVNWLSRKEGSTYRLPTEAEWEYACRAGTQIEWSGDVEASMGEYAWNDKNSGRTTHPVGLKKPNAWGLYDMQGNVWEWCQDWYQDTYYSQSPADNPGGPFSAGDRVERGGSWGGGAAVAGSAFRSHCHPGNSYWYGGFRAARTISLRIDSAGSVQVEEPKKSSADRPMTKIEEPPQVSQLAVAPFDATQARGHQERWAKVLKVAIEETNSLGMKLVLIPPGEFTMGSPDSEGAPDEHPQHRVRITKPFWLGMHEVTVGQFRQFAEETKHPNTEWRKAFPSQADEQPEQPVVNVNWNDANAFLKWLSGKEGKTYRLPTEAEWEYACRAGTQTKYSFGDDEKELSEYGWYVENSRGRARAAPVGQKKANPWGLYDMHGNILEWCQDRHVSRYYARSPASDPSSLSSAAGLVLRGGSWCNTAAFARSAKRDGVFPECRMAAYGFRAVRTLPQQSDSAGTVQVEEPTKSPPKPPAPKPESPELAVAAFDAAQAKAQQERSAKSLNVLSEQTNSIGMKLALIPAGEFIMGSPASEGDSNERPQHRVRITKPFWLGIHEVTVGQFRQFANATKHANTAWQNTFSGQTDEHPVVNVSWGDANAFLKWLSAKEGKACRLPTEAEWEYACRGGTQTKYSFGDDEKNLGDNAWYGGNSGITTHPVGGKKPNAWGLYDMQGNATEWCQDWYESVYYSQFANNVATDPTGPSQAGLRVLRGGCWYGGNCRPANRDGGAPGVWNSFRGFRLAL